MVRLVIVRRLLLAHPPAHPPAPTNRWTGLANRYHTCVSGSTGGLACFGINNGGQLGAETDETALGDDPNEVEDIGAIQLGAGLRLADQPAPGEGIALETISPTPAPTVSCGRQSSLEIRAKDARCAPY